jgi:hypothetical protein
MVVGQCNAVLFNVKKKWAINCEKTWEDHKSVLLGEETGLKRLQTVSFQLYDILAKENLWRYEKGPWLSGIQHK